MFPFLNPTYINIAQDIRSLSILQSANLLPSNGLYIPPAPLFLLSNAELALNPKNPSGLNPSNIMNPLQQIDTLGKGLPTENFQKSIVDLNDQITTPKGSILLQDIKGYFGSDLRMGSLSTFPEKSITTNVSEISSKVPTSNTEGQSSKRINSGLFDALHEIQNEVPKSKRKIQSFSHPGPFSTQSFSVNSKSALKGKERPKKNKEQDDLDEEETYEEKIESSDIKIESDTSILTDLIKEFPDWDLGDIINFVTTESDPLIIEETKKRAALEREEALKRALEENQKKEASPIKEEDNEDEDEFDENGRKRIKTRLWKNKNPNHLKPSNLKNNKGYVNRTFLMKVKQLLAIDSVDEDKVYKLLQKHQMEPKKALKTIRRNLEFYKNEFFQA